MMKDLYEFAQAFQDVGPFMELIDGRLFLDRHGPGALRAEIAKYADLREAQVWINLVPIDDFIDLAGDDWSMDDKSIELIADVYRRSWLAIVSARFGVVPGLSVDLLKDEEYGDVILRLTQE